MGIYEYTQMPFGIKNAPAHFQRMMDTIFQEEILEGWMVVYIDDINIYSETEAGYGATQTECLFLMLALEKLHYYLEGAVFEVYTDCTALKSLPNMKTTNGQMLRCQIAIQGRRGNMTIIYKKCKSHTNADGLSRWPLDNFNRNQAYDPKVAVKIPIHLVEIDRRKNFRFSKWAPGSGTPPTKEIESKGTETPILGIGSSELHNGLFSKE
ncbi:hypothetical protein O181_001205 [Austropuccinia psidii MF-1]|uniref:Reverse transcriptase RNase H-like domain-containing protein n=1 Tax=Austropuccinia psidii MF-1 TaxID=1389203 RepID=A0A9Q3BAJ4_9BASI|nr:hypothetical protein [Austropuccinia psidii MF-1]